MPRRKEYSRGFTHDKIRLVEASDGIPGAVRITGRCAQDHIGPLHPGRNN